MAQTPGEASATEMTTRKPRPYSAAARCRDTLVKAGFGNTPGCRSLFQVSHLGSLPGPILPLHQITSEGDAVRNACILPCLGEAPPQGLAPRRCGRQSTGGPTALTPRAKQSPRSGPTLCHRCGNGGSEIPPDEATAGPRAKAGTLNAAPAATHLFCTIRNLGKVPVWGKRTQEAKDASRDAGPEKRKKTQKTADRRGCKAKMVNNRHKRKWRDAVYK